MKWLIAVLLALLSTFAQADLIGAHLFSAHERPGFNDENYGVYYVHSSGLTAGHLRNSENRDSTYAGYTLTYENLTISVVGITGYKRAVLLPAIIPSYAIPLTDRINLRTFLLLNPFSDGSSAVHFSLEYRYE